MVDISGWITRLVPAADIPTPASGKAHLFFDTTDGAPRYKDAAGVVRYLVSDEAIQDAVGSILVDSAIVNFTYDDALNTISADLVAGSVSYAKIQNVSNTARLLGRITAGAGVIEELTGTQATTLLDVATTSLKGLLSAADKTKLDGIASGATVYTDEMAQDAVGGILSDAGDIDFDYVDATPAITATIKTNAVTAAKILDANVTNAKLANMAESTLKGRAAGSGTGAPVDLSATQATAILDVATTFLKGLMSATDKSNLDSLTAGSFTTGDVKATFKSSADTGWVMMNDGTIGNGSSGGTTRANADTEALFTLLWNNVSDTYAAVSGGRGANAAADFAANKTIALPKSLGRSLAVAGAGSGLTSRSLGQTAGAETETPTTAKTAAHTHAQDGSTLLNAAGASNMTLHTAPPTNLTTGGTTGSTGSGTALAIVDPTLFVNVMIKL